MELRDKIAAGALIVSILAIAISSWAAWYSRRQYLLNIARDLREQAARLPTFEHHLETVKDGRVWKFTTKITNRSDAKMTFDFLSIGDIEGGGLATSNGRGNLVPVGAIQPFIPEGIDPHQSASWDGFIVIKDDFAAGRGKPVSIVYAFRLIDHPDVQEEKLFTLILR